MFTKLRLWLTRPLEQKLTAELDVKRVAELFIQDQFNRARWEFIPTSFANVVDQQARQAQMSALYAYSQVWERLGHDTPDDIGQMILTLRGVKQDGPSAEEVIAMTSTPMTMAARGNGHTK